MSLVVFIFLAGCHFVFTCVEQLKKGVVFFSQFEFVRCNENKNYIPLHSRFIIKLGVLIFCMCEHFQ